MNERSSTIVDDEESNGIFYSVDKKKLVYLELDMLKEQKEKEKARSLRDLNYKIKHSKKKF